MPDTSVYRSSVPTESEHIQAIVLYCSDGRIGAQVDDFLQNRLKLPRYDRVVVPGGPGVLAKYEQAPVAAEGVLEELRFLIEAHGLSRVVLIQHQGCGFYKDRIHVRSQSAEQLQKADVARAAYALRQATGLEHIEGYFTRNTPEGMVFESVPLE